MVGYFVSEGGRERRRAIGYRPTGLTPRAPPAGIQSTGLEAPRPGRGVAHTIQHPGAHPGHGREARLFIEQLDLPRFHGYLAPLLPVAGGPAETE